MLNGSTPPGRLLGSTPPRMVQVISGRNLGSFRWFRFNGSGDGSGDGSAPPVIRVPVSGLRLTARVRRVSSGILLSGVCNEETAQLGFAGVGVTSRGHASGTLLRDDNTVKSQDRRRWHAADRPNCSTIDIERGARTDMRASPAVITRAVPSRPSCSS